VNVFFKTKFGTNIPLVDLINPDKLCDDLLKGFDFDDDEGCKNKNDFVKMEGKTDFSRHLLSAQR